MLICSLYFFAYPLPEYTAVFINEKMGATPRNSEGCSHLEISEKDLLNVIIILFMMATIDFSGEKHVINVLKKTETEKKKK